ncbi:MAG: 4Fe-4S dicluster domain-containing protein, partial [Oscillibacter sp.]|nr:4Fe-4S dicluster domain-containing protein [Oscillibacter sp.]
VELCKKADMGFIAMKGLSGGLLTNAEACYAFMQQYENVVPIWGIQREEELDQWLDITKRNVTMTPELQAVIDHDRRELAGAFCRGCGYCLPCPAGIEINNSARMDMLLRRSPYQPYLSDEWYEKMHRIENCLHCDSCKSRCPYHLDTPALLQYMLKDYEEFYAQHKGK